MKKVVFYMESTQIGGGMRTLLEFAAYLADNTDYKVYYVNFRNDIACETFYKSNIHFCDLEKTSFDQFKGATFFMPINHLILFLNRAKSLHEDDIGKLLLYVWHPDSLSWLTNTTGMGLEKLRELVEHSDQKSSLVFMDEACRLATSRKLGIECSPSYLPVAQNNWPHFEKYAEPKTNGVINIGWLGRIDGDKYYSLINLAKNLSNSSYKHRVLLHVIGDGQSRKTAEGAFRKLGLKAIFLSSMFGDTRDKYIRENVDIMVAMGLSALESCFLGVPTVFTCLAASAEDENNKYTYLHETDMYCLGWNEDVLGELKFEYYSINEVLQVLESKEKTEQLVQLSRDFAVQNFSIDKSANILKCFLESSSMTLKSIYDLPQIRKYFSTYDLYHLIRRGDFASYERLMIKVMNDPHKQFKLIHVLVGKFTGRIKKFASKHNNNKIAQIIKKQKQSSDLKRKHALFMKTQQSYAQKASLIKNDRVDQGEAVRVAFFVVFLSVFQYEHLFNMMRNDSTFAPQIVIIPNHQRDEEFLRENYMQTYNHFDANYPGFVVHGYDLENREDIVFDNVFDFIFYCNPYASMVSEVHGAEYFINQKALLFFANYSFEVVNYWKNIITQDFTNYLTTFFVESEENVAFLRKHQIIEGSNALATGYPKMDDLKNDKSSNSKSRKKVLLSPHHTVKPVGGLDLSNFLKYKEFLLELPLLYPQLDFIFRPHPLLFQQLVDLDMWTQLEVDEYLDLLLKNENIIYSIKGDYFSDFAESDALIHDCGSFVAEYLYTEKPCCFLAKSPFQLNEMFLPIGKECLARHYLAYCKNDIVEFIENTVIQEDDPLEQERKDFAQDTLKVHHPKSSDFILQHTKKLLGIIPN